jgi:hypothetical protein
MPKPEIKPDPDNARAHDQRNQAAIRRSLEDLGAGRSIVVDAAGQIIGGNETYRQAQALGIKTRIVATHGDELIVVLREDLQPDDPRRAALALADNRLSDLSVFDAGALARILDGLDVECRTAAGYDPKDLARILDGLTPPAPPRLPDLPDLPPIGPCLPLAAETPPPPAPGAPAPATPPAAPASDPAASAVIRVAVILPASQKPALAKTIAALGGSYVDCSAIHCDAQLRRLDPNAWALRRDKLDPQTLAGSDRRTGDPGAPA